MKILAFGEVMLRMMPPHYKTLTQTNQLEYLFTGTGVNILSGLYQMGDTGYLLTRLPDNAVGKAASASIRHLGIHDDFVCYGGDHIGIYFLEQGIGNRASQVTYLNRKESSFGQSHLQDYDLSCLQNVNALHICGISLALNESLREVAFALVEEAKQKGIKVIFDCNFRPSLWSDRSQVKAIYERMLTYADIVFAGIKDATLLLGIDVDDDLPYQKQVECALKTMCEMYDIEMIFGTMRSVNQDTLTGYCVTKETMQISSTYELTVFDRVGGGDGFAAGAIHGYFHHMNKRELIEYATCSGVLAHTTYGDSPIVSKDMILDFMHNGKSDIKR